MPINNELTRFDVSFMSDYCKTAIKTITWLVLLSVFSTQNAYGRDKPAQSFETLSNEIICDNCRGVKAVVMDKNRSHVYSINLEGMSVYEFHRASRQITRRLKMIATPGKGFNYSKKVWIDSYQEKPVEACFTHRGRYLWLSLHNAEGIVVWDLFGNNTDMEGRPFKEAWLYELLPAAPAPDAGKTEPEYSKKRIRLLWIKTGATPKVIASSPDGHYLFVSNWHSHTVSVIDIQSHNPADWKKIRDLKSGPIPRGLAVSLDSKKLYVAQMGGSTINIINLDNMVKTSAIRVGVNPRHLIISDTCLYASLNISAELVKIDLKREQIVQRVKTGRKPRTIVCTPDGRYLFVTCYTDNIVQLFATEPLKLLRTWKSPGHPVCVDVYQNGDRVEAWIGNHTYGTIRVLTLKTMHPQDLD